MMNLDIDGIHVESDGDYFTRIITKPFAGITEKVPYIKLDDVYVYFPKGKVIITKKDVNKF